MVIGQFSIELDQYVCCPLHQRSLSIKSLSLPRIENVQLTHRHTRGSNPVGVST